MKQTLTLLLTWLTLVVLSFGLMAFTPAGGSPPFQTPEGDHVVVGDNYTLDEDETLEGSLVVIGGNADLREGSTVEGDVVVLGGNVQADGTIEGDVNAIGGLVTLGSRSVVEGNVNAMAANLKREDGARIEGQVNTNQQLPWFNMPPANIPVPGNVPVRPEAPYNDAANWGLGFIGGFFWWLGRSFVWAFLALLALMFWPRHAQRIADAAMREPVPAAGLGLLTVIAGAIILTLLAITICGIPVSLAGLVILAAGWAIGVIALGLETGARIERLVQRDWAPPVQAALGTFVLTLAANGFGWLVPCVGWLVPFLVGAIGLGAALLTRFGSRTYPLGSALVVTSPAPPTQYIDEPPVVADDTPQDFSDDLPPTL